MSGNGANSSNPTTADASDVVTILSTSSIVLAVWATSPGNWLWAYPLFNIREFGDARQWRSLACPNGKFSFQNAFTTGTYMSAYINGVIHVPCEANNTSQLWNIDPFKNRAVRLQNEAKKICLQTPAIRTKKMIVCF